MITLNSTVVVFLDGKGTLLLTKDKKDAKSSINVKIIGDYDNKGFCFLQDPSMVTSGGLVLDAGTYDVLHNMGIDFVPEIKTLYGKYVMWVGKNYIEELTQVIPKISKAPLSCNNCGEWVSFAEPNQSDGTFACFSCRSNPYR